MKNIFFTLSVIFFLSAPLVTLSHGGMMDFPDTSNTPQMMRYIEDQALGDDKLHEEMEQLMVQMMSGELTQEQADQMVALMQQYPGVHTMMMSRLAPTTLGAQAGWGHMALWGGGFGSFFGWLIILGTLIWGIVGIMLITYLSRKLSRE